MSEAGSPPERVPGVLGRWLAAWAGAADATAAERAACVAGLDVAGGRREELYRRWLGVDWLIRAAAPRWLRAVGLDDRAEDLRRLTPVGSLDLLSGAGPIAQAAATEAQHAHQAAWYGLTRVGPQANDPAQTETWEALVEGAQTAARAVRLVLDPVRHAIGYPTDGRGTDAWPNTVGAITDAAAALAWDAAREVTGWDVWSWHLPPSTARGLAYVAARTALAGPEAATAGASFELLATMFTTATSRTEGQR